jgi:hypothetical protein
MKIKDLLTKSKKKYFLDLDYSFSPIIQLSATLALDYGEKVREKVLQRPLLVCFPNKDFSALWLSILFLINAFFEEHIDDKPAKISKGDKVKIYDTIAEVERINQYGEVVLKFKNQGGITLGKEFHSQMTVVSKSRSPQTLKRYNDKKREITSNRNAISKIIEKDKAIVVNQGNFTSKILLVTGRGNTKKIRKKLDEYEAYGEKLSSVFHVERNLIIRPDLSTFSSLFSYDSQQEFTNFRRLLTMFFETTKLEPFRLLADMLKENNEITEEFHNAFEVAIEECDDDRIKTLEDKYPGKSESLPANLKAVVINDVQQVKSYPETIQGLIDRGIPVVIVSDKYLSKSEHLSFYEDLFSEKDWYRINWSKLKLKSLLDEFASQQPKFIDYELWNICRRYANQKIQFKIFNGGELDRLLPRIQSHIKDLEGIDKLKKDFYNRFFPALYAIKNSTKVDSVVKDMVYSFKESLETLKPFGIPNELMEDLEKAIEIALSYDANTKSFDIEEKFIFSNLLQNDIASQVFIPFEAKRVNLASSETENIIFTGYPLHEYSGRYLLDAACVHVVPNITILAWENEAKLTSGYLSRRLKAGEFEDHLPKDSILGDTFTGLVEEGSDLIQMTRNEHQLQEEELGLALISSFRYKGYSVSEGDSDRSNVVKCNVLNFSDGSFMFLAKDGKVIADQDSIRRCKFSELEEGIKVFLFEASRSLYKKMAKHNKEVSRALEVLDVWHKTLVALFKESGEKLNQLEEQLEIIKVNLGEGGNPSAYNLRRWLFDEDLISPRDSNLKIILTAGKVIEVDKMIREIHNAFSVFRAFKKHLGKEIENYIGKKAEQTARENGDFEMMVPGTGVSVKVSYRTITSLEKEEHEVRYYDTNKILC